LGGADEAREGVDRHELRLDGREPEELRGRGRERHDLPERLERRDLGELDGEGLAPEAEEQERHALVSHLAARLGEGGIERAPERRDPVLAHAAPSAALSSARQTATSASRLKPPPKRRIRAASSVARSSSARPIERRAVSRSPRFRARRPRWTR